MNLIDFIDSHYYAYNHENSLIYFKFKNSIKISLGYELQNYYTIFIYENDCIFSTLNGMLLIPTNNQYYTEVDFSIIINHLPKNHPDRIEFRKQRIKTLLETV